MTMGDGGTALVYVWGGSEDYWQGTLPGGADDQAAVRSPSFGKVAFVDAGGRSPGSACERLTFDRALVDPSEIGA